MKLIFRKQTSASVLSDFHCGVGVIDAFIHGQLEEVLDRQKHSLYTVHCETGKLVAMFITSPGAVLRSKGAKLEIEETGTPHTTFDNGEFHDMIRYDTLELDYLAVREEYRGQYIGTEIIEKLSERAVMENRYFITVGAYHDGTYSAIPFYEKNHFCAVEEYDENEDTLRMYKYIRNEEGHACKRQP